MDIIVIGAIHIASTLKTSLKPGILNQVSEYEETFSGSALHIAVDASLLKAEVGIISPVGRDAVGLLDIFRRNGIDYSHIVLSSKKSPLHMTISATKTYNLHYEGALSDFDPKKLEKSYLKKAKVAHVCFPDEETTHSLVKMAQKAGVTASVEGEIECDADIVFTQKEGKGKNTVVMNPKEGIICNKKEIPVFRSRICHENGVKDAFIAAFLTMYAKSRNLDHSALYGSCAAYWCSLSEKPVLTCTKEEVDALFEEKASTLYPT